MRIRDASQQPAVSCQLSAVSCQDEMQERGSGALRGVASRIVSGKLLSVRFFDFEPSFLLSGCTRRTPL
jgi:hypothetical protein